MAPIRAMALSRPLLRFPNSKTFSSSVHEATRIEPLLITENWRNSIASALRLGDAALIPFSLGFLPVCSKEKIQYMSRVLDKTSLINQFADWIRAQRYADVKQLFEFWIRYSDESGKPNHSDVNLYNHYLTANLMMGASVGELLDLVAKMDEYGILPNTDSFNLVLKAMQQAGETQAAVKLFERMLQTGTQYPALSLPDDESYELITSILLSVDQVDDALNYVDHGLKNGRTLSVNAFVGCVKSCANKNRLDILASVIGRYKKRDRGKSFCPPWHVCNYVADIAVQSDNGKLACYALEFIEKWIARGLVARPAVVLSVDEGFIVSALGTAGRTYNSKLLDDSWAILKNSFHQQKLPEPETYLAKINAYANMGSLQKAFSTLRDLESAVGDSELEDGDLFSPFYCLNPLVKACTKEGSITLDVVYYQLEKLSRANPPYKSVSALNCIILGSANIWDLGRACRTFNSIGAAFGVIPNIHSYNALICAFGKLRKRDDAVELYKEVMELCKKPNVTTYSLLVDAHLIVRDPKAALHAIDGMMDAGFEPSREMLKKVRRRCVREMDYKSDDRVEVLAREFKIQMGTEQDGALPRRTNQRNV